LFDLIFFEALETTFLWCSCLLQSH